MKSRYNPLLLVAMLVGLCCALWLNWLRYGIEEKNNTVEIAMEYENLRHLAALEGRDETAVLQAFREAGVTSLMLFDTTLERLAKNGTLFVATGAELRQQQALGGAGGVFAAALRSGLVPEDAVYLAEAGDAEIFDEALADLQLRYGSERVLLLGGSPRLAVVKGSSALVPENVHDEPLGLLQAPLGISSADIRRVAAFGFHVIVRPQNYAAVRPEQIDSLFRRINASAAVISAYMPCGTEVVGFPGAIDYMGRKMRESQSSGPRGMKLIMLEHYTQLQFVPIAGLTALAAAVDYNAARSYVIDGLEQKKISVGEALRRWAITDEERNIRLNYIRPFLQPRDSRSLLELNLDYVRNIVLNVTERGYQLHTAGVFAGAGGAPLAYFPERLSLLPVLAGIVAAVIIYLALLLQLTALRQLLLWLVGCAAAVAALFLGHAVFVRQLAALAAAIVFPVLSLNVILDLWQGRQRTAAGLPQIICAALWQLALAIALSLAGAAFLSAILTDVRFLLEIDIYRGVKLTFVMPLILLTLLYIKKYVKQADESWRDVARRAAALLEHGLTLKHLAVLGLLLFIAYYFVGRSGHTGGVPVLDIEVKMRLFLEQVLYARPREKEFMIGHPAFFLAVYAAYKGAPRTWQYVLACAAVIGQGSLVETFCHMRTPVIMSLARALNGYAAGAVAGIVALLLVAALLPRILKFTKEIP